jgi:hypothetical protein
MPQSRSNRPWGQKRVWLILSTIAVILNSSIAAAQIVTIKKGVADSEIKIGATGYIDLQGHCFGYMDTLPTGGVVTIFGNGAVAKNGNLYINGPIVEYADWFPLPGEIKMSVLGNAKVSFRRLNNSLYLQGACRNANGIATTRYEPSIWNDNGERQFSNFCYNYALNQMSNDCAQPGYGTGHPYVNPPTVAGMRVAAESDGLIWVGDSFPGNAYDCGDGHLVFVMISPGVVGGYHWLRLDQLNGRWSGKNSSTAATNLDANGNPISNPLQASFGMTPAGFYCAPGPELPIAGDNIHYCGPPIPP